MFFAYLTLFSALLLAAVAGVFSVTGMMALFAGIPMAGMAVGIAVELGKLMAVSWLYRHWKDGVWFRHLMASAALIAMLVTSIGVFGYLSKAHYDQGKDVSNDAAKVQVLDEKIDRIKSNIDRKNTAIKMNEESLRQLDAQISILVKNRKISDEKNGSRAVLKEQQPERDRINRDIKKVEAEIDSLHEQMTKLQDERFTAGNTVRSFEVEVGPLKSVASLVYDDPKSNLENAIRLVIILIMVALDPMAIMLLMGYNHMVMVRKDAPNPSQGPLKSKDATATAVDSNETPKTTTDARVQVTDTTGEKPTQKQAPVKKQTYTDVRNGIAISVPVDAKPDMLESVKNKINNTPEDGWLNKITKRKK